MTYKSIGKFWCCIVLYILHFYSCQAKFSNNSIMVLVLIGLILFFIWGMFGVIGVMLCKNKYCSNSARQHEKNHAVKNFTIFLTLFVLLGLANIFTNFLFLADYLLQKSNTNNSLFTIVGFTIVHIQGPALLVFQGVKLKEVRSLWQHWITVLLQCSSPTWLPTSSSTLKITLV